MRNFGREKSLTEMKFSKIIAMAALCFLAASCGSDLNRGLVLYSNFEGDARDLSSNKLDGILRDGAEISDDCAVGESSIYFNGERAYVEYPSGEVYFQKDYSVSIWVKWEECRQFSRVFDFNQVMPGDGNAVSMLIGRHTESATSYLWFDQWAVNSDGEVVESILDVYNEPGDGYLGYKAQTGQWDHYVLVYDSSASNPNGTVENSKGRKVPFKGAVTLYVNGKKVGTTHNCMKPQDIPTVANWLGRSRYMAEPRFKGWMDDFRIYDRCLSENEITALYKLGSE